MRALLGRLRGVAIALLVLAPIAVGLLLLAARLDLEVPFTTDALTRTTTRLLGESTDAHVELGSVHATFGRRVIVEDVRVSVEGEPVLRVPRVELVYALGALLHGRIRVRRAVLERPWVRAVQSKNGWRLPRLRSEEGGSRGPGGRRFALDVERVDVADGRVEVALDDGRRFAATGLALRAAVAITATGQSVRVESLRLTPRGIDLRPTTAAGRIVRSPDGVLELTGLALDTGRSRIAGSATIARGNHLDARLDVAPLAAADVRAIAPASRLRADVEGVGHAHGPWRAIVARGRTKLVPGGAIKARLTFDARSGHTVGHARFRDLDPGAAVAGLPAARLSGRAAVDASRLDPRGPLSYRVALAPSRLFGEEIERLEIKGRGHGDVHRLRASGAVAAGSADVHARVTLATPIAYRAAFRYDVPHLERLVAELPGRVAGRGRVTGRGTAPEDRRATVAVVATTGHVRGRVLRHAEVKGELAGERLRLDGASVDAERAHLEATGSLDLARRESDLAVSLDADLSGLAPDTRGRVAARGRIRGPLDALAADATATLADAGFRDVGVRAAEVQASAKGIGGKEPSGSAHVDAADVRFRTAAPYAARADVTWRRAGQEDRIGLTADAHAAEGATQAIDLTLVRSPRQTSGELRGLALTPLEGSAWRLATPTTFTLDDGLSTSGITLVSGAQRIVFAGRIGLRGASDATLRFDDVELAPVCALGSLPSCAGALAGTITVNGTAAAPLVDAGLQVDSLRVRDVESSITLGVHYAERMARVDGVVRQPTAGTLVVAGTIPVDLAWSGERRTLADAPVALTVRADALDLALVPLVVPRLVREATGRLDVDLRVGGTRAALRPMGTVAVAGATIELAGTGIAYEDVRVRIEAAGTHVTVSELHAAAGEGTLDGHGSADFAPGGSVPLDLAFRLDRFFAVRQSSYEATLGGTVAVHGSVEEPNVTGDLQVERAVLRPAGLPSSGPAIRPDPTITVVGETVPEPPTETGAPAATLAGPLRLGLRIRIQNNAWIRRNDASIELGGELSVSKVPNGPMRVSGQIQLLRGWYEFQGRRFEIERGSTITFTGGTPLKPIFDVTAVHNTHDYRIQVRITGSIEKPRLDLVSDPPLEKADILSVLLFGKPTSEIGRGESVALQQQALALAAGYAVPELRSSVMNSLGLDTLDVQMPERTTDAGRVSAGRYVAEDIFVSLAQEFGTHTAQVVGVEYLIGGNVSVKASTSTRGNSAIDLFWRYRY